MSTLHIDGMHCGHCKNAVEKAAAAVAGVLNPTVDLANKQLHFEESAPVDMDTLKKAVRDIGFEPR